MAGVYARHRPGYPATLLAGIEDRLGAQGRLEVLDLGAGTGLSSRAWAERGHGVVALDPSGSMLRELNASEARRMGVGEVAPAGSAALGERVWAVRAAAERLPFAAGSFDLIVGHQCFHWFELGAVLAQIRRVGRSQAWAAAVWNTRRASGLAGEYERILRRHSRRYAGTPSKLDTRRALQALLSESLIVLEHHWSDQVNLDTLLGRTRSASYVEHGAQDVQALLRELTEAFKDCAVNGVADFDYCTTALLWPCGATKQV